MERFLLGENRRDTTSREEPDLGRWANRSTREPEIQIGGLEQRGQGGEDESNQTTPCFNTCELHTAALCKSIPHCTRKKKSENPSQLSYKALK